MLGRSSDNHRHRQLWHQAAEDAGPTCSDCHQGIAQQLPMEYDPERDAPGQSIFYRHQE